MSSSQNLWRGLRETVRHQLIQRDYQTASLEARLSSSGIEASKALAAESALRKAEAWIPGIELFPRAIHLQRHRGIFGEFARQGEGVLGKIGLWPKQWATARMTAGTAKGFHIHPPFIPENEDPVRWFARLYVDEPENFARRPYHQEQWDVMFFVQGRVELFLIDERLGLPRRIMCLFIDGDNYCGSNNVGVVIPPGVAHAIRTEGSEDIITVYGTSTVFEPTNEGRVQSNIECATLPAEWELYLK